MSKTTRQDVLTVLNEPTIKQRADGIMALIGGSEWISVDDGLPDEGAYVVLRGEEMYPTTGYLEFHSKGHYWKCLEYDTYLGPITHWMPLPEPSKETKPPADTG